MQVLDIIRNAQGGQAVDHLARTFNIAPEDADAVIEAVLPRLSSALERNTLSRGGLADLVQALGQGHHAQYLDDPRAIADPSTIADGNAILGHILGDRDKSRAVAVEAARFSGVSEGLIKMLLPILATWLMGALSKGVGGGLGDILGRMGGAGGGRPQSDNAGGMPMPQGGGRSQGDSGGGYGMPRLPEMPGGGQGIPMPDMGGEQSGGQSGGWPQQSDEGQRSNRRFQWPGGNTQPSGGGWPQGDTGGAGLPMPDLRGGSGQNDGGVGLPMPDMGGGSGWPQQGGSGGRTGGGSPLPLPGDQMPNFPGRGDNPYGDLSDILRRGGQIQLPGGGGAGGSVLWSIVRNVIGSALGFKGGGIMSWLFRMIVMRFGWGLLKTILGRGFLGR